MTHKKNCINVGKFKSLESILRIFKAEKVGYKKFKQRTIYVHYLKVQNCLLLWERKNPGKEWKRREIKLYKYFEQDEYFKIKGNQME